MKGRPEALDQSVGSDSFLDVATNIVGILIILVMVVGIRARNVGLPASAAAAPASRDVSPQLAEAITADVAQLARELAQLRQAASARRAEQQSLASLAEQRTRQLDADRQRLDQQTRLALDAQRAVEAAQAELQAAADQLAQVSASPPRNVVQVMNYPTPISHSVFADESHFQVRGGNIVEVPIEELVALCKSQIQQTVNRLEHLPQVTQTLGPVRGFRLQFTLERHDLPLETQLQTGHGSLVQFRELKLIPVSEHIGESLDRALAARSEFRTALAQLDPRRTTITLWTFPDSFAQYRVLKENLHALGFAVAGRPLPEGQFISGSPQGSYSAAQ